MSRDRRFSAWFQGSCVVDPEGKPRVVYHGTASDFSQFDTGRGAIYFTSDPDIASLYAYEAEANGRSEDGIGSGPSVMPVYLSIKRPLILDEAWAREHLDEDGERQWTYLDDAALQAEEDGHDGMILRGVHDYAGMKGAERLTRAYDQYLVFSILQIKSAIGNSGAFDPRNPELCDQGAPFLTTRPSLRLLPDFVEPSL